MNRAVFLDRDGVIIKSLAVNGRPVSVTSFSEVEILPGVQDALNDLRESGFELVVVTNQPDVGRGKISIEMVEEIHNYLRTKLDLSYIYTCFHDESHKCDCRKPRPGLLFQAANDLNIDLNSSFMVGDRWRDIDAGFKAGCKCFFISNLFDEKVSSYPFTEVESLLHASILIKEN